MWAPGTALLIAACVLGVRAQLSCVEGLSPEAQNVTIEFTFSLVCQSSWSPHNPHTTHTHSHTDVCASPQNKSTTPDNVCQTCFQPSSKPFAGFETIAPFATSATSPRHIPTPHHTLGMSTT